MSPQKTKNLIILILVLVNVFLLALVIPDKLASHREEQQALTQLSLLYERSGITLDADILPEEKTLFPLSVICDTDAQHKAIGILLGKDMSQTQTTAVTRFTAADGSAELQGNVLTAEITLPAGEPLAFTKKLLKEMGISFSSLQETKTADETQVTAQLQIQGVALMDESMVFTYENGVLTRVSGLLLPDSSSLYRTKNEACLGLWDALVKFRSSRITTGWMGSSVTTVEQVFLVSSSDGLGLSLVPQWRMDTDMGPYLVDGESGEVTAAS